MEEVNIYIPFIAALIPLIVGAVYYNPNVFGTIWMRVSGTTEEKIKSGNMALIFGLSYLFSLVIAGFLIQFTIHQAALPGLFVESQNFGISAEQAEAFLNEFNTSYGHLHRTFSHGAVHGLIACLMFAFPLIAINSLFERRGWKYIWVHTGYWLISLILMGGVICAYF